jgi:UDP-N-acetylglucosamine acyltransferase
MSNIHPTAIVSDQATVDPSALIGPFCIVEAGAEIGPDCVLDSQVRVYAPTRLGRGNRLCHGAAIGAEPQDLTYHPEKARPLVIGDYNHFKENVTISCGVKTDHGTVIGNHNYLMNGAHIGHDCIVGDHNILASNATLAGHVQLEHHIFLSGMVAIHQFCRVGAYVMVGGISGVRQDIPPYCMANGQYAGFVGLNLVGLKRNGFNQAQRTAIKRACKILFRSGLKHGEALARLREMADSTEVQAIVTFVENAERGLISAG